MRERAAVIMTTVDSEALAERIAGRLLEERLAACIQEIPISSRYRWQGAIRRDAEILLLVKTSAAVAEEAVRLIAASHDYEVPEVVVLPVTGGLPAYLDWILAEADGTEPADPGA